MTVEQEARQVMIGRLRGMAESLDGGYGLGETTSPQALAVHLNQAANEIDDLGRLREQFLHGFRMRLYTALRDALHSFHPCDANGMEPHTTLIYEETDPQHFTLAFNSQEVEIHLDVQIKHKLPRSD